MTIFGALVCVVVLGKFGESVNPLGGVVPEYPEYEDADQATY